ncbi:uncharacterized protein N7496_010339 [Penicillium cataractarum]|uniref:Uncharacterized protein n=1 Tax=Penicillium cataractarum TaxID=2100454 RepID=A0A9W9RR41_9EURO|nr:uncharacterized protein N7496_010339 [Penicillium cataractarum]KAJ5364626.1 hypothetical protein N7496_010339 [Penicillium cataractarum]
MSSSNNMTPTPENGYPQNKKQTYSEWAKGAYNDQYEKWMPWIEDQYLKWFGRGDNKASYATKGKLLSTVGNTQAKAKTISIDTLAKTKVTGIDQVDKIQDDTANLVGNQIGDKGLLKPVGQFASKEGVNRAERNGKDESGSYMGPVAGLFDKGKEGASSAGSGLARGAESVQNAIGNIPGAKSVLPGNSK